MRSFALERAASAFVLSNPALQRRINQELEQRASQMTKDLQRSVFYLQQGQSLSHSGSWSFLPSGQFDYLSPELYRIFGFHPSKQWALSDYVKLVHPADRARSLRDIPRHRKDLLGVLIEEQVIIAKVSLVHGTVEILRLKQRLPSLPPCKRCEYQTTDGVSYH